MQVFQNLRNNGLPNEVINKVNNFLNNPLANPMLNAIGLNKTEFKQGLQSIIQPDNNSALTSKNSLLQGIEQLKHS